MRLLWRIGTSLRRPGAAIQKQATLEIRVACFFTPVRFDRWDCDVNLNVLQRLMWICLAGVLGCSSEYAQPIKHKPKPQAAATLLPGEQLADRIAAVDPDDRRLEITAPVNDDTFVDVDDAALETLICDAGIVTDRGVERIAKISKLQHLRLRFSPVSDAGMRSIAKCQSLWFLNLPHAKCTADGVADLAALPELRSLRLGSPALGPDAAAAIAKITSLRSVHLINVPIDDVGLKQIAGLPELESLYLDGSAVSDAGWEWLFDNHADLHVHVDQGHHDYDPSGHEHS